MSQIDSKELLNTSAQLLADKGTIQIRIEEKKIRMKLPTTRDIAKILHVPHYYVLPAFCEMEESGILTREERVGIWTTEKGTKILIELMMEKFPEECKKIIGPDFLKALADHSGDSE